MSTPFYMNDRVIEMIRDFKSVDEEYLNFDISRMTSSEYDELDKKHTHAALAVAKAMTCVIEDPATHLGHEEYVKLLAEGKIKPRKKPLVGGNRT